MRPARSRQRITGARPMRVVTKSPGAGIRLSWPTNRQARAAERPLAPRSGPVGRLHVSTVMALRSFILPP